MGSGVVVVVVVSEVSFVATGSDLVVVWYGMVWCGVWVVKVAVFYACVRVCHVRAARQKWARCGIVCGLPIRAPCEMRRFGG